MNIKSGDILRNPTLVGVIRILLYDEDKDFWSILRGSDKTSRFSIVDINKFKDWEHLGNIHDILYEVEQDEQKT